MRYPRLKADLDALKAFGAHPDGGWDRPAYSDIDRQAHDWAAGRMREAGLAVRHDGAGNLIGRLDPSEAGETAAVAIGSHLDTVHQGGWLDGALGVLAGLEVARRIGEDTAATRRPLEVIAFRDEEGRFGAFTGSRAMAGQIGADELARMKDAEGTLLADALGGAGLSSRSVRDAARAPREIACYLELHIEQGPVLEARGVPLGIVTAIAGQARLAVRFEGRPDHAGTTPMGLRADAYAAAAAFSACFEQMVHRLGEGEAVGTIGIVRISPNVGNVVPARASLGLEMRDIDSGRLARIARATHELARTVAEERGVAVSVRTIHEAVPSPMHPRLRDIARRNAERLGIAALDIASGAGHDAQPMSAIAPAALLFAPSIAGRSHCPEEDTAWADIEGGVAVLEAMAGDLARSDTFDLAE